jgi:hypothetical protein
MRPVKFALPFLLVFVITEKVYAQSISWDTANKYPKAGTKAKSIAVAGTIKLASGFVQGDVKIEIWAVSKTSEMLQAPFTIKKADLVKNQDGTYSFGPVDVPVSVPSGQYNVIAKELFTDNMGNPLDTAVTQPVVAMASGS